MSVDDRSVSLMATIIGDKDLSLRVCEIMASRVRPPSRRELMKIRGVGPSLADKIIACVDLSAHNILGTDAKTYMEAEDVARRLSFLKYSDEERFVVITLDAGNHEIGIHEITKGLVNQTPLHARELFRHAVVDNAVSIIMAHNHPSGSNEFSEADYAVTRCMCASGKILQIPVIDHFVISRTGFASMCRERPYMFEEQFDKKEIMNV